MSLLEGSRPSRDDDETMSTTEPTSTPLSRDLDSLLKDVRDLRARVNATFQRIGNEPQSVQSVGVQIAIHREAIALVLETETSKNADDKRENADDKREAVRRLLDACNNDVERLQLASDVVDRAFHRAFGEPLEANGTQGTARPEGAMRRASEVAQFAITMGVRQKRNSKLHKLDRARLTKAHAATERTQENMNKAAQPFFVNLVRTVEAAMPRETQSIEGEPTMVLCSPRSNAQRLMQSFAKKHEEPSFADECVIELLWRKSQERFAKLQRGQRVVSTSTIAIALYSLAYREHSARQPKKQTKEPLFAGCAVLRDGSLKAAVSCAVDWLAENGQRVTKNARELP